MIEFQEALAFVLGNSNEYGEVSIPLHKANGRVLAENVFADRDFPPFNRATKDGIALNYHGISKGISKFKIQAIAPAGTPQLTLNDNTSCIEVMTGAVLPKNSDTVVMYEHITIQDGFAALTKPIIKGQNIHSKGTDEQEGALILKKGLRIAAAEIGILASVGKSTILVKKNPKVCLVSTGNELVNVDETPKPHQIRKSNSYTLEAGLLDKGISPDTIHIADDKIDTMNALTTIMSENDVVLLSGGVSKGKYDYLPEVFLELGITKIFHKVKQRPGKPFWFGKHQATQTTIFGFPGNPGSTFANFYVYFLPWLNKSLGLQNHEINVILEEEFENTTDLTRFIRAKAILKSSKIVANLIHSNGSGDLTSLTKSNGFIKLAPNRAYKIGQEVVFIPTKRIV
ncbi:molybdopterin molybdotransferase MoeA [Croceitalea rosinachiae]|uniref:Molybdopterin molybdenumtransferase n=1 Tax=Croceitalea rosinachiae TaxID=3075596 RepID=A0ABU3ACN7_9FLAO|nr:molybdopterin molybdotransferase MoeA [Croceitalea sp. F388]MDT0607565.1 molybdopterin molybdotransferase MoeA [Croceitalea sp. F388]